MSKNLKIYILHISLFLLTFMSTTFVGAENVSGKAWFGFGMIPQEMLLQWRDFPKGLSYSLSFMCFLTFHEFGHYLTARYHDVKASLPFYIPIWLPMPGVLNIGSFGAVIRLKQVPATTQQFFDIGIAGPLAGFVVSVGLIIAGLLTLPSSDYLLRIHPEYQEIFQGAPTTEQQTEYILAYNQTHAADSAMVVYKVGTNLLVEGLRKVIPHDTSLYPSVYEYYHYPLLFVGFLTLFFTALNLLPIGQLDGGHIIYGMFGRKVAGYISRIAVVMLILFGGTGFVDVAHWQDHYAEMGAYFIFLAYVWNHILNRPSKTYLVFLVSVGVFLLQGLAKFYFPTLMPNFIWVLYAFLAVRVIKLDHPPAFVEHTLSRGRLILGWIAIVIFILCFTPAPVGLFGG